MATEFINGQWRIPNSWDVDESNQGKISNYSMEFNGTSDSVNVGLIKPFDNDVSNFAISYWIKANFLDSSKPFNGALIHLDFRYNAANRGVAIESSITSLIFYTAGNSNTIWSTPTSGLNNNEWNHIVVNFDGSIATDADKCEFWINGSKKTSTVASPGNSFSKAITGDGFLGNGFNSYPLEGKLDQFCTFDYTLSASQVSTLYGDNSAGYFQIGNPMALSPSPVAYYQLGDQDVNFNGGTWTVPNNSLSDYVFNFDGTDDYLDTPQVDLGSTNTISFWINNSVSNSGTIFGDPNTFSTTYAIAWGTATNVIVFRLGNGNSGFWQLTVSSGLLQDGNWHHHCLSRDGVTINYYIDGALQTNVTNDTLDASAGTNTTIENIIARSNGTSPASGKLSNVALFNSALTGPQVATLYNNGAPGDISSLSPVAWYKLNASEIFNGTSTEWSIDNNAYPSVYNSSLNFDGVSNQKISVGSSAVVNLGIVFTFSAWIKPNSWTGYDAVYSGGPNSSGYIGSGGNIFVLRASGQGNAREYALPSTGSWTHICLVRTALTTTGIKMYYNGVEQTALASDETYNISFNSSTYYIGNDQNNGADFNGQVSNTAIWNTELTSTQITTLYNNGTPALDISSLNPASWWKLNNTTTGIQDSAGSNNGTNSGATKYAGFVNALAGESSGMDSSNLVVSDLQQTLGYSPYSIELNGADQFFTVDNSSKNLNTENVSISTWFFQDDSAAASGFAAIIINGFSGSGSSYWGLVMRPGNIVRAQLRLLDINGNFTFITEDITQTIVTGQWNHIAMTYDGTTLKGYINGVEETLSLSGASGEIQYSTSGMNSQDVLIGKRGTDNLYIDGKISNFAIWGSGLTSTQIATIYNNGLPNDISSLNPLAWWELGAMTGFNGTDTWTAISNSDSNFAAVSEANMAAIDLVNGPGYSDGAIGTSSLVIAKQAPYSFNNALSESMAISNRDDSQASDPYPMIIQLDLSNEVSSYTFISPIVNANTYPYTVDWGDGNIEQITSSGQLVSSRLNHVYDTDTYPRPVIQFGKFDDVGQFRQFIVNNGGSRTQMVELKQWGQIEYTSINFYGIGSNFKTNNSDIFKLKAGVNYSLTRFAQSATSFNPSNWNETANTSQINNLGPFAFYSARAFNQDMNKWDTSSIRSGQSVAGITNLLFYNFFGAVAFNGNIDNWYTTRGGNAANNFYNATVFNRDISTKAISAAASPTGQAYVAWNMENVTSLSGTFVSARAFNANISNWNTNSVTSLSQTFYAANLFNRDINTKIISAAASPTGSQYTAWDTTGVTSFYRCLYAATAFNQNLQGWNILSVPNNPATNAGLYLMLSSNGMSINNYTDTIVGFAVQVYNNNNLDSPSGINMGPSTPSFDNTRTQNTDNDGTTTDYSTLYGTDWPGTWTEAGSAKSYLEEDAGWTNI